MSPPVEERDVTAYLAENRAHINDTDANNWTPLLHAIVAGQMAVFDFLVEQNVDTRSTTPVSK